MGLLTCRPDGAINISPRWGYKYGAPMGLLTWRPDGAGDMEHWLCKTLPITQASLFLPQRGKIFLEKKGYPLASPVGAAQKKRAFRRVLDFRNSGRAAARPDLDILDVKGGAMKAFP